MGFEKLDDHFKELLHILDMTYLWSLMLAS